MPERTKVGRAQTEHEATHFGRVSVLKKTAKWVRWGNKETARNSAIPISAEPGGRNWRWQRKKCLERAPHDAIMPHLHDATNERRQQPQTFRCHPPQIQPTPTQTHTRTHAHKKNNKQAAKRGKHHRRRRSRRTASINSYFSDLNENSLICIQRPRTDAGKSRRRTA